MALPGVSAFAAAAPGAGAPEIEPRITLAKIHPTELSLTSAVALPRSRRVAGSSLETRASLRLSDFPTTLTRELPDLWRLWLSADTAPSALEVTYEVVSARGRRDRLSHRDREESEIAVRLRPVPPAVLQREGARAELGGGVVLELDLAPARAAGTYLGTITVTVTDF